MGRRMGRWAALAAVAVIVAGCGGGGPRGGQPAAPAEGAITVTETEWAIRFPGTPLKAGKATLVIRNEGTIEHNFVIQGLGVEVDAIPAGGSRQVTVDLRPGTYEVVCNIPGHLEAGMKTTITVAP
ncbi:MAG: cupredoxin domain-containing protein [Armatimonadota bacterium]|nr:cupredoxin domain-containing protein [Armatimonadota bacterium]